MDSVKVTADTLGATIAESLQEFSDEKMKEIKEIISLRRILFKIERVC